MDPSEGVSSRIISGAARMEAPVRTDEAKRTIEAILAASMPKSRRGQRAVVICYHSVHPTYQIRSATPSMFERQIAWLEEHCDIVPFHTIGELMRTSTGPRPLVAVTFDDGYEDNHRYALPILRSHGVHATIFVTTGLIDRDPAVIHRLAKAWGTSEDEIQSLTWSQISEMDHAGFDIAAHTRTHPVLRGLDARDAAEEIRGSRAVIEDHLGASVPSFAYPFGVPRKHLDDSTIDVVAQLGFATAGTILYRGIRRGDDALSIPRFPVTRDSMSVFLGKIHGRLDAVGLWQAHAPRRRPLLNLPDDPSSYAESREG